MRQRFKLYLNMELELALVTTKFYKEIKCNLSLNRDHDDTVTSFAPGLSSTQIISDPPFGRLSPVYNKVDQFIF